MSECFESAPKSDNLLQSLEVCFGGVIVRKYGGANGQGAYDGDGWIVQLAASQLLVERFDGLQQVIVCCLARRLPDVRIVDGGTEEQGVVQVCRILEDPAYSVTLTYIEVQAQLDWVDEM